MLILTPFGRTPGITRSFRWSEIDPNVVSVASNRFRPRFGPACASEAVSKRRKAWRMAMRRAALGSSFKARKNLSTQRKRGSQRKQHDTVTRHKSHESHLIAFDPLEASELSTHHRAFQCLQVVWTCRRQQQYQPENENRRRGETPHIRSFTFEDFYILAFLPLFRFSVFVTFYLFTSQLLRCDGRQNTFFSAHPSVHLGRILQEVLHHLTASNWRWKRWNKSISVFCKKKWRYQNDLKYWIMFSCNCKYFLN